jgi:signal transduction histidine kinase
VQNLEAIIRDILAFAGGAEPNMAATKLSLVVDTAVEQARPKLDLMEIALRVDQALYKLEICCDQSQMERAFTNLIFNAIDAVGSGGCIGVRLTEASAEYVSIAVEDNGPGIDLTVLPRIFNPFFTTKDGGTGLGLSIVHGIVEGHGGSVTARNRAEGGASFVMTLPLHNKQAAHFSEPADDPERKSLEKNKVITASARRSPRSVYWQGGENTNGSYRRS